jgi:thioredoxin-like negative regulator of GroEL
VGTAGTATDGWALVGRTPAADERVLLLQLSSPVCAPCRQTAAVLDGLAATTAGVVHVEVDVAEHPDVARSLHVLRTPTTVAFDRAGGELLRVAGVPRVTELASALAPALFT